MAEYITKIRTEKGDMQIDYNALANKPTASSIGAALADHRHTKSEISDFPTSLPANGGNADTLGNKPASDFALVSNVEAVVSDVNTIETNIETIQKNIETIQENIETIQENIYKPSFDLSALTVTTDELNHVKGVTSNVQEQLDGKAESGHTHTADDVGAYNLLRKTPIHKNTDLNTYTTPGTYTIYSWEDGKDVLNNIPDECGTVIVEYALAPTGASWGHENLKQTYRSFRGYDIVRTSSDHGETWNDWVYSITNVLPSVCYGPELPDAGTEGRIFFKKV